MFLKWLFKSYFSKKEKEFENRVAKELEHRKYQNRIHELTRMLGHPVIAITNEWEDPIIGFLENVVYVDGTFGHVTATIKDYISNQEIGFNGKIFLFNRQLFKAIFKLNPFERCEFIYNVSNTSFNKGKYKIPLLQKEVFTELKKNGFWKRMSETGFS